MAPSESSTCAVASAEAGAELKATATSPIDVFFVLEYPGAWGRKAVRDSELPEVVKDHLEAAVSSLGPARIQLVRRGSSLVEMGPKLWLVRTGSSPRFTELHLRKYHDIPEIDLVALAAGEVVVPSHVRWRMRTEPMVLVCTNGKRDACCAKYGPAVHRAFEPFVECWQTTHLGGHRFAATVLCLPEGILYGRVTVDEVEELATAQRRGEIHRLDHYRGRCSVPEPQQAAEHAIRELFDLRAIDALVTGPSRPTAAGYEVEVALRQGSRFRVEVRQEPTGTRAPSSCGDAPSELLRWNTQSVSRLS